MARPAKKQPAQKFEEPDEAEGWEDAVVESDEAGQNLRLRDWRDVERFREMKELRSLVDDDYGLEEIFHVPMKPRAEPAIPGMRTPAKGVPAPAAKPAAKEGPKAAPAKPGKPQVAAKPAPHKPAAKVKAKAKRK